MHRSTRPSDREYVPVETKDLSTDSLNDGTPESEHITVGVRNYQRWKSSICFVHVLPWILTVMLSILLGISLAKLHTQSHLGTYEMGFKPDFSFPMQIPLEKLQFQGSPHFHSNGTPWMRSPDKAAPWPENVRYVGEPSSEVDANWQQLIGQRYFSISDQEAKRAWGDKRHEYIDQNMGGYTAGFDMFHTLHCINELRKALYPDYYPPKSHTLHGALHNDHCIEILRQTVQCYGSTTLIPTRFMDGLEHNYIDSDQVHVCRSFNFIRDYTRSRMKGKERYVTRDKSLLDEGRHAIAKAWGEAKGDNEKGGAS